ncbi:hypothetical protein QQZ08_004384 [Neonectria magnoliae]|uniref:Beta-lactamase-related domain-containing protein n=1 Tax=Neonectria magnoliae TaxID=2732573 RepID=A0ABR1I822_9HYPO
MAKLDNPPSARSGPSSHQDIFNLIVPIIQEISQVSGTPGLAVGVFDRNGKIFDSYHGYRDTGKKLPPDAETVLTSAPCAKALLHSWLAVLLTKASFTGMNLLATSDALFIGSDNQLLLTKTQGDGVFASLAASRPPRQDFIYNNFGYHAVGRAIERVSSMNYGDFLAERLFEPLDMKRTFTQRPPTSDNNIAQAYVPYHSLKLRQMPPPIISSDTVAFAAGGIRSCMRDLLVFYSLLLRRLCSSATSDPSAIRAIFETTTPLHVRSSLREQSYGMGWARTQLPNQMSEVSGNSGLLESYPTIGDAANGPLVFYHSGNNVGCSSTIYLIPELDLGIVVLGNALAHCDATDWTAQVLAETYLCGSIKTPFLQYVTAAASQWRSAMERVQETLDKEKQPGDAPEDLGRYTGCFWHKTR